MLVFFFLNRGPQRTFCTLVNMMTMVDGPLHSLEGTSVFLCPVFYLAAN